MLLVNDHTFGSNTNHIRDYATMVAPERRVGDLHFVSQCILNCFGN
uniref:Uncharacterized protein n=1 Tax=Arundo donax TaxID=35708 RepID=A0A0A9CJS5_ARUDO